jgi:hypothetical protein
LVAPRAPGSANSNRERRMQPKARIERQCAPGLAGRAIAIEGRAR